MNFLPRKITDIALEDSYLSLIIAANLLGTLFGFYYYLPQFTETNPLLWIFVADSPLATLFIAVSLLGKYYNMNNGLVDVLAFIGNIKYGLWTVFVLLFYFETFWTGNTAPMYFFLLFSHLGMFLQAFLIPEYSDFSFKAFIAGGSWFLVNDLLDYGLDIHTYVYTGHSHPFSPVMFAAVSLTSLGVILTYLNRSF